MFLPLLHVSLQDLQQFLERASPALSYISKEACDKQKKRYIYLSIYRSPSERYRMLRELERCIFIMRYAQLRLRPVHSLFIRRLHVIGTHKKTVESLLSRFCSSVVENSTWIECRSVVHSLPGSLRPLHSNAAYAISISASPERAVRAVDGIEKKVSSVLKVSAARPGLRTKC